MSTRVEDLNRAVTDAIVLADRALEAAREAWVHVATIEGALATAIREDGDAAGLEYGIALRGGGRACLTVELLTTLGSEY